LRVSKNWTPGFGYDTDRLHAAEIGPQIEAPKGDSTNLPELGVFPGKNIKPGARGRGEVDEACVGGGERGLSSAGGDFDCGDREVAAGWSEVIFKTSLTAESQRHREGLNDFGNSVIA